MYTILGHTQNLPKEDFQRVTVLRSVSFALFFAPSGFCADTVPARVAEVESTMIERVAAAISVHEGWNNLKSLVRRQHNPGALIYVGQPGARQGKNGYAWFKTDEDGKAALLADLRAKSARGWTLRQIMERWSVRSYGKEVSRETGIRLDAVLQ
jgi:hypothetical protein